MSSKTEVRSETPHAAVGKDSGSVEVPPSDHALICFSSDDIASSTAGDRYQTLILILCPQTFSLTN